jgi:hypothetical protein
MLNFKEHYSHLFYTFHAFLAAFFFLNFSSFVGLLDPDPKHCFLYIWIPKAWNELGGPFIGFILFLFLMWVEKHHYLYERVNRQVYLLIM